MEEKMNLLQNTKNFISNLFASPDLPPMIIERKSTPSSMPQQAPQMQMPIGRLVSMGFQHNAHESENVLSIGPASDQVTDLLSYGLSGGLAKIGLFNTDTLFHAFDFIKCPPGMIEFICPGNLKLPSLPSPSFFPQRGDGHKMRMVMH